MGYNLTYSHLAETNAQVKSLYADFDKTAKKIQKVMNRKYKSQETNILDAMIIYAEGMALLPIHLSAIQKTHENKVAELKQKWTPKSDGSLVDARLALEFVESLHPTEQEETLKNQAELRSLLEKHKTTFGTAQHQALFDRLDSLFTEVHAGELAPTKEAFEAVNDLQISFEHKLQQEFDVMGGFGRAEQVYMNFVEDKSDEDDGKEDAPPQQKESA